MAASATGNMVKRRFDWSEHFTALRRLLRDEEMYVPEAAAWALAQMSRAKYDIGPAMPELVELLSSNGDYNEPRKEAAKALLHHARKSAEARDCVRQAAAGAALGAERKEVRRF